MVERLASTPVEDGIAVPDTRRGSVPETAQPLGKSHSGPLKALGPYRLEGELGKGGMGVVYEATDTRLNRRVAVKVLVAGEHADSREIKRFRHEAESAARLKHPNIVPIYDVGNAENLEYLVMERVEGQTLGDWLRRAQRTFRDRARVLEKVARAIHHAHEQGIVHRDIKPGNVMVDNNGLPHVMDFGLARTVSADSSLTASGAPVGTPQYMSPEQARGARSEIGAASDVWSLGAVLYEMLTGRPPFTGETILFVIHAVAYEDPVAPRQIDSKVPRDLETIAMKCLAKDAARRYPSAEAMADDLRQYLDGEPISARPASLMFRVRRRLARHSVTLVVAVAGVSSVSAIATLQGVAGVAAAAGALLMLVAFWARGRISREREEVARQREVSARAEAELAAGNERAQVLASVSNLLEVFEEKHDVDAVLSEAVDAICGILSVKNLVLNLYGTEESLFRRCIVKGDVEDIDLGAGLREDVMDRARSRLINGLDSVSGHEQLVKDGFRSVAVSPLTASSPDGQRQPVGYVAVLSKVRRDFTTNELSLLHHFAQQASIVIANAQLYQKTHNMAMRDGLTNLYNYRRFRQILEAAIAEAGENGKTVGLVVGDLDHFKDYNEAHGRFKGDEVLREVGEVLRSNVRGADSVALSRGEEFAVVLPSTDQDGSRLVGEVLRARVAEHSFEGEDAQPGGALTITFGIAMFPTDAGDAESLIEAASRAVAAGKRAGRNRTLAASDIAPDEAGPS